MARDPKVRIQVEAELRLGKPARELSEKHNIPYATIRLWAQKLKEEPEADKVADLIQVDPQTLEIVAQEIKERAPKEVAAQVDKLVEGVVGLQLLDEKFRTVVLELLEWAELKTKGDMSITEWAMIGKTIGTLYTSIFNKNITNVNVLNNNNISTEKRDIFKSSLTS